MTDWLGRGHLGGNTTNIYTEVGENDERARERELWCGDKIIFDGVSNLT